MISSLPLKALFGAACAQTTLVSNLTKADICVQKLIVDLGLSSTAHDETKATMSSVMETIIDDLAALLNATEPFI